jgi:hypothetical protein
VPRLLGVHLVHLGVGGAGGRRRRRRSRQLHLILRSSRRLASVDESASGQEEGEEKELGGMRASSCVPCLLCRLLAPAMCM